MEWAEFEAVAKFFVSLCAILAGLFAGIAITMLFVNDEKEK